MVQYGVPEIRCHIACPRESLRALRPRRTRRPSAPSTAHQGTLGAETAGAPRPAGLPVHASLYKGLLGLDTRRAVGTPHVAEPTAASVLLHSSCASAASSARALGRTSCVPS